MTIRSAIGSNTRRARVLRRALIVGGLALFAFSLVVLVGFLARSPSQSANIAPSTTPTYYATEEPDASAVDVMSAREAVELLDEYIYYSDPEVDEDLAAIQEVINDQAAVIDRQEVRIKTLEEAAEDPIIVTMPEQAGESGVTTAVAIAGAVTGAVAAAAGVISAVSAMRQRRDGGPVHVVGA